MIAILLLQGKLPFHEKTAELFRDINWNSLNDQFKRNYRKAAESVMKQRDMDIEKIEKETQEVYEALGKLDIVIKRGQIRPVR